MANSLIGGFLSALAPAMQQGQESQLKKQMLDMQMQDYKVKQAAAQREAATATQQRQLIERWKTAPPEERQAIEREISLNQGKIPGQTVAEQMADFQKGGGMGMSGGGGAGGADNPYAQGMDMAPTFGPKGMTMTGSVRHPSGKQAEVQGLLYSVGADPNNRAALIDANSVINASPEAQYQLTQRFQSKYGGGQQQPAQGAYSPTETTALGPTGRTYDVGGGNVATELSITVTDPRVNGGKPTNIPLLTPNQKDVNGLAQQVGRGGDIPPGAEDMAIQWAAKRGGFPSFGSIDEAVTAAKQRSATKGQMLHPQQQEPGIEAVGPDGQPIMFDNQATMDEYKQRGLPLGPNGGAQQPRQAASGGNPYDVIRQKEISQRGAEAGITARQSEANKTLPEGTQKVIRDSENMRYQVGQLARLWRPEFTGAGAQGPLQAMKKYTGIGLAPGEADYNAITANMRQAILRGDIGSAQTASELVNALDRIGEPGMTDEVYRSRLGVLDQLLTKANEDAIGLATTPLGGMSDYLKNRRQAAPNLEPGASRVPGREQPKEQPQQRQQHAGVAVGGTVDSMTGLPDRAIVEDDQGRKFIIKNGRPMPYPGK